MREEKCILALEQLRVHVWLLLKHINPSAGEMPGLESISQVLLINQPAACLSSQSNILRVLLNNPKNTGSIPTVFPMFHSSCFWIEPVPC